MITSILEEQGEKLSEVLTAHGSIPVSLTPFIASPRLPSASPASVSNRSLTPGGSSYNTQFLLPSSHSATLLRLLSLPPIRNVVGDFEDSYFLTIEEDAGLPHTLNLMQTVQESWPPFEPNRLRAFAETYFSEVSAHLPLLTKEYYNSLQNRFFQSGPAPDIETAICLSVWALGCIALPSTTAIVSETLDDPSRNLGVHYFAAALRIIVPKAAFQLTPSIQVCQALILAALYFSYLGRPLHSWKMIQSAAQKMLEIHHT